MAGTGRHRPHTGTENQDSGGGRKELPATASPGVVGQACSGVGDRRVVTQFQLLGLLAQPEGSTVRGDNVPTQPPSELLQIQAGYLFCASFASWKLWLNRHNDFSRWYKHPRLMTVQYPTDYGFISLCCSHPGLTEHVCQAWFRFTHGLPITYDGVCHGPFREKQNHSLWVELTGKKTMNLIQFAHHFFMWKAVQVHRTN